MFFQFLTIYLLISSVRSDKFKFKNCLPRTIWVNNADIKGILTLGDGSLQLNQNQEIVIESPPNWHGRFWAEFTPCPRITTGTQLECGRLERALTIIEINEEGPFDYYDISLINGFNVPVSIKPVLRPLGIGLIHPCRTAECNAPINEHCPEGLREIDGGKTVGCKSTCMVTHTDKDCCRGAYNSSLSCTPSQSAIFFRHECPDAKTYPYDKTGVFTCSAHTYSIEFGC